MTDFIVPPKMEDGDKVAIVRSGNGPAKTEFSDVYELGLKRLENVFRLEPVVFNLDFGHTHPIVPVSIGGEVEMYTAAKSIRFS